MRIHVDRNCSLVVTCNSFRLHGPYRKSVLLLCAILVYPMPMIEELGGGGGGFAMAGLAPGGGVAPPSGSSSSGSTLKTVDRVRNVFPERWLWSNASLGFVICPNYVG